MNETGYELDLLKAMNKNLSSKDRMYRLVCDMTDGAFLYFDIQRDEIVTLGKWSDYFDFPINEKRDVERIYDLMEDSFIIPLREIINLEITGKESASMECLTKKSRNWFRFQVVVLYDETGNPTDKVIGVINITKYKLQAEELNYYSYYDVITGLFNRNYFVRLLGDFLQKAEKENETVSVIMFDIDDFHKVNDGLGMIYGDELIQQFGAVLKEKNCETIMSCHLNSDIYCMAIYGKKPGHTVEDIHQYITDRIERPFALSNGQNIHITITAGVAEYPEASTKALDLINCAEIVMLKGKSTGKNSLIYFDEPILKDFLNNLHMETKLKSAVNQNKFELYFQPQYYAGNNKLRGLEALIRWHDLPDHMILPGVFIPIAEKTGAIIPIGDWVVEEAIRQYARWRNLFGCNFIISINVSARQFNNPNFLEYLMNILDQYKVDPYQVELEITESILIDDFNAICEKLKFLQSKGVRISLDDFGTGFSSLSYLKKLPINTLKIDKSFIDTVLVDSTTRIITESIISMVKSLGFESIAEGVEEDQQLKYLHAIGCDVIQGYLLGKPMPAPEIDNILQNLNAR